ncbi:GyrI-like domain-containing protein [Sporolactobacillus shoreicorticis]|uniref:GyrI-like domain-containing protein n=1 Tax=Sporolactobacillus shoreicorticis TaxID=1923877 RepID=A0ABW5S1H0_9BACL|nr:GyrI-like domain-containing protein [Sporolactobacillus shoreicorticis]MCO7126516.1 GyrI-like domain-containing protein [Sporolactobacillus shoreicorticis]
MDIRVERFEATSILYMRRVGEYGRENNTLMSRFKEKIQGINTNQKTIYGIAWDNPQITPSEACRYDVALEITSDETIPEPNDFLFGKIPGGHYMVLLFPHFTNDVQKAMESFPAILQAKGYTMDGARPIIERYRQVLVDKDLCELCVPIL